MISSMGAIFLDSKAWSKPKENILKIVKPPYFPPNFWTIEIDLSGNTVFQQASGFQKLAKMNHFGHF